MTKMSRTCSDWADASHTCAGRGVSPIHAPLPRSLDRPPYNDLSPPLPPFARAFRVPMATHGLASDGVCTTKVGPL